MKRREARQTLLLELRGALTPAQGERRAFVVERLRIRSRDVLLTVSRETVTTTLRLVPRDPLRSPPGDVPWSRWFLLLPAGGPSPRGAAADALVDAVRERLRSGERRTLGRSLDTAFADQPVLAIPLPGSCQQACVFCRDPRTTRWWHRSSRGVESGGDSLPAVRAALRAGRPLHGRVLFQGDDALSYAPLPSLIAEAAALGYEGIAVLTPGARLGSGALTERLVGAGLDTLEVALYGATADEHDGVTRAPGTFEGLMAGLGRARRAGVHVIVHTALTHAVLPRLGAIAVLADANDFCFERADGVAADRGQEQRYCGCAPTVAELREAITAASDRLPRPFTLVDVPDCALPRVADGIADGIAVARRDAGEERWPTAHAAPCQACARSEACPGPSVAYVAAHGADDLLPF